MSVFKQIQIIINKNVKPYKKTIIGYSLLSIIGWIIARKYIDKIYRKIKNYPPGPIGLPIFGCLFHTINNKFFKYLSNNYGGVVMVQMGFRYVTYINDYDILVKSFKKLEFCNRAPSSSVKSISSMNGEAYLERRTLLMTTYAMMINSNFINIHGNEVLQSYLFKELDYVADKKQEVVTEEYFQYIVFVRVYKALFGDYIKVPGSNDQEYKYLTTVLNAFIAQKLASGLKEYAFKPFYVSILSIINLIKAFKAFQGLINQFSTAYKKSNNNNNNDNNNNEPLIGVLMKANIDHSGLVADAMTICASGISTIKGWLTITLLVLGMFPDIQQKLYNELKISETKNGEFTLTDIQNLHYLRAVVHESFRSKSNTNSLERYILNNNIKLNGYNIPKGSLVYTGYSFIMNNNNNNKWIDSSNHFNINNFLDKNNKFKQNNSFVSFGVGKRSCSGESLAKREVYYILARIILRYKVNVSNNVIKKFKELGDEQRKLNKLPIIFEKRN